MFTDGWWIASPSFATGRPGVRNCVADGVDGGTLGFPAGLNRGVALNCCELVYDGCSTAIGVFRTVCCFLTTNRWGDGVYNI